MYRLLFAKCWLIRSSRNDIHSISKSLFLWLKKKLIAPGARPTNLLPLQICISIALVRLGNFGSIVTIGTWLVRFEISRTKVCWRLLLAEPLMASFRSFPLRKPNVRKFALLSPTTGSTSVANPEGFGSLSVLTSRESNLFLRKMESDISSPMLMEFFTETQGPGMVFTQPFAVRMVLPFLRVTLRPANRYGALS